MDASSVAHALTPATAGCVAAINCCLCEGQKRQCVSSDVDAVNSIPAFSGLSTL